MLRTAVAQQKLPASDPAQSDGTVQATWSSGAHVLLQVVVFVAVSAQHCVPLGHGICGQVPPLELPLLLPLELPPLLLPLELPPLLLPLELPPLLLPLELPPLLLPLELPPLLLPLELPLPDDDPPSSPPVAGVGEELPHAIHTNALATTAAALTVTETDAREAM
jgi:hypothetical protein